MPDISLIKTVLRLEGQALSLDRMHYTQGCRPENATNPNAPVPNWLLGYWVDLLNNNNEVIYRRFLTNNIPLYLEFACAQWEPHKLKQARFSFLLPALRNANTMNIYEQRLNNQKARQPSVKHHLNLDLLSCNLYSPRLLVC